jgi:cbb3-type cytochrome oxidase subunit 1
MERFVVGFLRSSLAWLAAGVTLGVAMAVHPAWVIYRDAHLHMLLLGFVVMMIAGVAYHVLPRFSGAALYSRRLALWHLVIANVGLVVLVAGFVVRFSSTSAGAWLLGIGGTLSAAGAYALGWNLWRTLDRAAVLPSQLSHAARPLPLVNRSAAP